MLSHLIWLQYLIVVSLSGCGSEPDSTETQQPRLRSAKSDDSASAKQKTVPSTVGAPSAAKKSQKSKSFLNHKQVLTEAQRSLPVKPFEEKRLRWLTGEAFPGTPFTFPEGNVPREGKQRYIAQGLTDQSLVKFPGIDSFVAGVKVVPFDTTAKRNQKMIYLMRHGQGYHNIPDPDVRKLFDPELTPQGHEETRECLQGYRPLPVQRILVSPLKRTLQTAYNAFRTGDTYAHVPMQTMESLRERIHCSDPFNKKDETFVRKNRTHFSQCQRPIDLDEYRAFVKRPDLDKQGQDEEDELHVIERANFAAQYLLRTPEQYLAVVSHSEMINTLLNIVLSRRCQNNDSEIPLECGFFQTGQMKAILLTLKDDVDAVDQKIRKHGIQQVQWESKDALKSRQLHQC